MAEKPRGVYVPLDVLITDDEDIAAIGMFGFGLFVSGLCYAKRKRTDGVVPRSVLGRLLVSPTLEDYDKLPDTVKLLVEAGLWIEEGDGYRIRSWEAWNPTDSDREKWAERKRKERSASRASHADVTPPSHGDVTPESRLEEKGSRREEKRSEEPPSSPSATVVAYSERFERVWKVYPRHQAKGDSYEQFKRSLKLVPYDALVTAVERYAADPNLPEDQTKIPHFRKWLHDKRWDDDPLPSGNGHRGETDRQRLERLRTGLHEMDSRGT